MPCDVSRFADELQTSNANSSRTLPISGGGYYFSYIPSATATAEAEL
jgi:hypothetical protein